jgi:hypothetical protein
VIKEIAVMDTLPITSPVAAALALAEVLGFDLPVPCLVSVAPWLLDTSLTRASVSLQFSGPDQLDALHAWAAHFGSPVVMPAPEQSFAYVRFTHCGVRFQCYAELGADES